MLKAWGWYLVLLSGAQFKIKLLYFKKGGAISMQRHWKRAELWMFLFGKGLMHAHLKDNEFNEDLTRIRSKGSIETIPSGFWHQYKAEKPTLVLEVQYGLCREDDIERA